MPDRRPLNVPDPVKQRRATAGGFLRAVYAFGIFALAAFLGWQVLKPAIYTEGPGLVAAPAFVVSTPYAARILSVPVEPGSRVKKGQIVATIRSPEIFALRASLLLSMTESANKIAELAIKHSVAEASLKSARHRLSHAVEDEELLQLTPKSVSSSYRMQVVREVAVAQAIVAQLEAEIAEISVQLPAMKSQLEEIKRNWEEVQAAYNDGRQSSPVSGLVGPRVAQPGQSVSTGHSIIEIYDDAETYVEWILAAGRIRQPQPGARVYIIDGARVMRGRIEKLREIAERNEVGQFLLRRSEAGQLVRIKLDGGERYPPLLTTVNVRFNYWRFMDPAVELYVQLMTLVGLWRDA